MPFAIVNRIIEEFNTNGISAVLRADNILDYQMSNPSDTFGLTDFQKESLKEQEILPLDYGGGTVLAYKVSFSPNNEWKVVHGTVPSSPSITDLASQYASTFSGFTFGKMTLVTIDEAMNDGNFKTPYTTASKTWRGGNSGWYDTLTSLNESIRGLQRSRFYASTIRQGNTISSAAVRNIMKGRTITNIDGADNVTTETPPTQEGGSPTQSTTTTQSSFSGLSKATLKAASAVSAVSKLASGYCMYVEMANKVQTIVQAVASMQQMNLVTGYTEAVQKVQSGDDTNGVALHEYANNLVAKDDSGKSSIESAGLGAMFSGDAINPNDESVKTATVEGAFANLSKSSNPVSVALASAVDGTTNFLDAMTRCTYIEGTLSAISSILTIVGVATGGTAKIIEFGIQFVIGVFANFAIRNFTDLLIDWFWDNYGAVLEKDLATAVFGEDLGNALTSGANKYLSSNHQVGGGSPGNRNSVISFRRQQEIVLAEEAEYQRSIRSPFDIDSQHTFLGSIVYSLVPLANTSGVGSIVKTMGGVIQDSVTNLLPTASAVAETNLINSIGECPTLESIGIVGDAYCNPYFISDTSTNTSVAMLKKLDEYDAIAANGYWRGTGDNQYISPEEVIDAVYQLKGIESTTPTQITGANGVSGKGYKIRENSNLYKYAKFCGARTSSWGFADANIADQLKNSRNDNWWNKIPIIGSLISSVVDMINAGQDKEWISGAYCVAREYKPSCDICDKSIDCFWQNEGRYYQRFIEDQRYIISASSGKDSDPVTIDPVSVALNDYYAEHPLDQSFEGILARYSGMTKDDVIATLELIDGLNYIANYHPEERADFLAVADGSLRTIPQGPAVGIINIHESSTGRLWAQIRLDVVIPTTATRGPVRREPFVTA